MTRWRSMDNAPHDGTCIQVKIPGHGDDNVVAWLPNLLDEDGDVCGGWNWMAEPNEPPDDWTDGICWAINEDGVPSTKPTGWKPLLEDIEQ